MKLNKIFFLFFTLPQPWALELCFMIYIGLLLIYQGRQISFWCASDFYSESTTVNHTSRLHIGRRSSYNVVKLQQLHYEQSRHHKSKNQSHYHSIKLVTDEQIDILVTTRVWPCLVPLFLTCTYTLTPVSLHHRFKAHLP